MYHIPANYHISAYKDDCIIVNKRKWFSSFDDKASNRTKRTPVAAVWGQRPGFLLYGFGYKPAFFNIFRRERFATVPLRMVVAFAETIKNF